MRELNYEAQEMLLFRRMPKGEMRGTNNRLEEIRWNMLHGRRTAGGRESRSEEALLNWGNPQGSCSAGEGSPSAIGPSMDGRTAGKGFGLPRLGTGSGVSWGVYWASGQPVPPIVRRRAPQIEARGPLDALGCFGGPCGGLGCRECPCPMGDTLLALSTPVSPPSPTGAWILVRGGCMEQTEGCHSLLRQCLIECWSGPSPCKVRESRRTRRPAIFLSRFLSSHDDSSDSRRLRILLRGLMRDLHPNRRLTY